jgi:hypothetical protein
MQAKRSARIVMFILLVIFSLLVFYAIFNTGNPNSLFRLIIRDPSYDLAVTLGLGVVVGALVVLITATREGSGLTHLLEINTDYIRELRRKGKTDMEIADSFLRQIGSRQGLLHSLAKRRVLRYLSKL